MQTYSFKTPLSSKKNRPIIARGRYIPNPQGKRSQAGIHFEAWHIARQQNYQITEYPVRLDAIIRKTRSDCVNLLETILDALQGVAYVNDRQVVYLCAYWDFQNELKADETARVSIRQI